DAHELGAGELAGVGRAARGDGGAPAAAQGVDGGGEGADRRVGGEREARGRGRAGGGPGEVQPGVDEVVVLDVAGRGEGDRGELVGGRVGVADRQDDGPPRGDPRHGLDREVAELGAGGLAAVLAAPLGGDDLVVGGQAERPAAVADDLAAGGRDQRRQDGG